MPATISKINIPDSQVISAAGPAFEANIRTVEAVLRKQLFFIVGCPKSGTTWMKNLLHSHPEIACRGETNFVSMLGMINQLVEHTNEAQKPKGLAPLEHEDARYLFVSGLGLLLAKWGMDEGIRCVGEKTPNHAVFATLLLDVLPGAKIIHIVRDPRDATVSGWFHNLSRGKPDFLQKFPDLNAYAQLMIKQVWPTSVGNARAAGEKYPERYHEVRYEDMIKQPKHNLTKILQFLGQDHSPDIVDECISANSFQQWSEGRTQGQEDPKSFYRKGVVGDWKNHLDDNTVATFRKHLGPVMTELGYLDD